MLVPLTISVWRFKFNTRLENYKKEWTKAIVNLKKLYKCIKDTTTTNNNDDNNNNDNENNNNNNNNEQL